MNKCSYFIDNKALFGSYPTKEDLEELENNGVEYFINLTFPNELKTIDYSEYTNKTIINFPIRDKNVPRNWKEYSTFIIKIVDIISSLPDGKKIYIHCKGGHGRSGIIVASLLIYLYSYDSEYALELTCKFHSERPILSEKRRKLGCPHLIKQKTFVINFFSPLFFYRPYTIGYTAGFSLYSLHNLYIYNMGNFKCAEAAYRSFKNIKDTNYIFNMINSKSILNLKSFSIKEKELDYWKDVNEDILYYIIDLKYQQNPNLKDVLMNTGLRPIIYYNKLDSNLGCGFDKKGYNKLGICLYNIRDKLYRELI
jgi:predicted NAD-dependent protein-ADP-ribosyltransferase YbiA (DUF1768 family)